MRTHAVLIVLLVFLIGCSSIPEYTFNADNTQIKSIAVAPTQHDEELLLRFRQDQFESVDILTPIPVAKLFTYVAEESREARFAEEIGEDSGTYAKVLQQSLKRTVGTQGFRAIEAPSLNDDTLSRDRRGLLKKIPASAFGDADAILESSSAIGFTAAGRGKPFKPTLWFTARLTDKNGTVLLYDQIQLNPDDGREKGLIIYPSDTFVFENQEELADDKSRATALQYAIDRVAVEFAYLLRGPIRDAQHLAAPATEADSRATSGSLEKLALQCKQPLNQKAAQSIPKKEPVSTELDANILCRWNEADTSGTGSVLFRIPASESPTEIEVSTRLDPKGTTAANAATLDASFEPVEWIPFSSFRERRGRLVARFFVSPSAQTRYVLIGGAEAAVDATLARTYAPVSTSLLNLAGLVTARELADDFSFIPEGEVKVKLRKSQTKTVKIVK